MSGSGSFLVVGEALVDEVRRAVADGPTTSAGARPAASPAAHPGGSPANVAVGLARLGSQVGLLTRFGADAYGALLREHLERNGVELVAGAATASAPATSVALAQLDEAGGATYTFSLDWDLPPVESTLLDRAVAGATCLHTGSLATALAPGAAGVRRLVERARAASSATVSYDPNLRPALLGAPEDVRPDVQAVVALADVVKASEEDLRWLLPGEDPRQVAARWLQLGPALVVVTRGGQGAYAVTRRAQLDVPAPPVDVVDTVGAGDAFTAGLLDGLDRAGLLGDGRPGALADAAADTLSPVLEQAVRVGTLTCARPGADPPTRAELAEAAAAR